MLIWMFIQPDLTSDKTWREFHSKLFTEEDWPDLTGNIDVYQCSKTMAERAAWEFAKKENLELSSVNPVVIIGPLLGKDFSYSNQIIRTF